MRDEDEQAVRDMTVEILMLVNRGRHKAEDLSRARRMIEEAVRVLRGNAEPAVIET